MPKAAVVKKPVNEEDEFFKLEVTKDPPKEEKKLTDIGKDNSLELSKISIVPQSENNSPNMLDSLKKKQIHSFFVE